MQVDNILDSAIWHLMSRIVVLHMYINSAVNSGIAREGTGVTRWDFSKSEVKSVCGGGGGDNCLTGTKIGDEWLLGYQ